MRSSNNPEIERYWRRACETMGVDPSTPHVAYTFADPDFSGAELVAELNELARAGKKRGTAHLVMDFELNGIPRRKIGDYWVVLDPVGEPVCVVRIANVEVKPFKEVGEEFAASEGEGDLSLEYWRQAHRSYFERQLAAWGREWRDDLPVVCESFEPVYAG